MDYRRVFIRRLSCNVTVVETMVESLYDVCYVMECRLLFFWKRLSSRDHCRKECRSVYQALIL